MTKAEQTNNRDLGFNNWVRERMPDSYTGYRAYDVDWYLWNKNTKRHIILELKTFNAEMSSDQRMMYQNLARWIKASSIIEGWYFGGCFLITLGNNRPDNGTITIENILTGESKPATEDQLIYTLNLLDRNCPPVNDNSEFIAFEDLPF